MQRARAAAELDKHAAFFSASLNSESKSLFVEHLHHRLNIIYENARVISARCAQEREREREARKVIRSLNYY